MEAEEESKAKHAKLNISFTDMEGAMATLYILDRMEERQRRHGKMLHALMEKVAPELADSEEFKYVSPKDWLIDRLLRIQEDVDLVKRIVKKDR
jgi:hypothetical protein